jgi:hypothetical protein
MGIVTMGIPREITLDLANLNGSVAFVETGTYAGATTRWASEHFARVHTIERAEAFFQAYGPELQGLQGVTAHLGDSRQVLPAILRDIGEQTTVFWLDGHWSGGQTAGEDDECPLLGELACLSGRLEDIILIDDARLFLSAPPPPHKPSQWPTISEVIAALPLSGRRHFVQVVDDVIFAVPGEDELRDCLTGYARRRSSLFWEEFARRRAG